MQTAVADTIDMSYCAPRQVFPFVLYEILKQASEHGYDDIVSWSPCGQVFKIHRRDAFVSDVLPRFFKLTRYKSFSRQLNLWGYTCIESGPQRGSYAHPSFQRGNRDGCKSIVRQKTKRKVTSTTGANMAVTTAPMMSSATGISHSCIHSRSDAASTVDQANALITADIMAFLANAPTVFGGQPNHGSIVQLPPEKEKNEDNETMSVDEFNIDLTNNCIDDDWICDAFRDSVDDSRKVPTRVSVVSLPGDVEVTSLSSSFVVPQSVSCSFTTAQRASVLTKMPLLMPMLMPPRTYNGQHFSNGYTAFDMKDSGNWVDDLLNGIDSLASFTPSSAGYCFNDLSDLPEDLEPLDL